MPTTHPPLLSYSKGYKVSYNEAELNAIKTLDYTLPSFGAYDAAQFTNRKLLQSGIGRFFEQRVNKKETTSVALNRVASGFKGALGLATALFASPLTIPTSLWRQHSQFPLSFICPDLLVSEKPAFTEESPIHIFHMNMGLGPDYKNSMDGLTSAKSRAERFIVWVEEHKVCALEKHLPEVMLLQEVFDKEAEKIICEKLKEDYPYIIYNVAPHFLNMGSGQMILSKYPLSSVTFEVFNDMPFPDKITAPRGILIGTIKTKQGILELFNIHTAPLLSDGRCAARKANMEQIYAAAKANRQVYYKQVNDNGANLEPLFQVICGDTNLQYPYNTWNQELSSDHPEYCTFKFTEQHFRNACVAHTAKDQAIKETELFLKVDRQLTKIATLTKPAGTWLGGTYTAEDGGAKGLAKRLTAELPTTGKQLKKPEIAAKWNKLDFPIFQDKTSSAMLDLTLIPKPDEDEIVYARQHLEAIEVSFEIRNMEFKDATSGMSDHKGCSALVFADSPQLQKVNVMSMRKNI